MELSDLKLDLVQLLLKTNDKELLEEVKDLLASSLDYTTPQSQKDLVRERKANYLKHPIKGKSIDEIAKGLNQNNE